MKFLRVLLIKLLIILNLVSLVSAYQTVKATKITADPDKYSGKKVLLFVKFNQIVSEGIFTDFLVKGMEYHYDINDEYINDIITKAKQRDLITVKGEVFLEGFNPNIKVEGIVTGWIDTTLLPLCPDEIKITCPECGKTFIYDVHNKKIKDESVFKEEKKVIKEESEAIEEQ
ncbi:hypothetical protein ACFL4O_00320 [bacterium]